MRTDSTRVSTDALEAVREHIASAVRQGLRAGEAQYLSSKKNAQDAHEAIRPTSLEYTPERVRRTSARRVQALHADLEPLRRQPDGAGGLTTRRRSTSRSRKRCFRATGQTVKFDGFMRVYTEGRDERAAQANGEDEDDDESQDLDGVLPDLQKGDALKLLRWSAPALHPAAAALHAGDPDQGARGERHRPAVDLRVDHGTILDASTCRRTKARRCGRPSSASGDRSAGRAFPDILNVEFTAGMEESSTTSKRAKRTGSRRCGASTSRSRRISRRPRRRCATSSGRRCRPTSLRQVRRDDGHQVGPPRRVPRLPHYPECKSTKNFKRDEERRHRGRRGRDATRSASSAAGRCWCASAFGKFLGCTGYPECKNIQPLDKPVDLASSAPTARKARS